MGDHDATPTCLSAEHHEPGVIRDFAAHYFGCIEIHERVNFFDKELNKSLWDHEVDVEEKKLAQQSGSKYPDASALRVAAEGKVEKKIQTLAVAIESQYKRTDTLRKALESACCTHVEGQQGLIVSDCNLVKCLSHSHREWKDEVEKTSRIGLNEGINLVRKWRQEKGKQTDTSPSDLGSTGIDPGREAVRDIIRKTHEDPDYAFEEDGKAPDYKLERDINGYIIQWDILQDDSKESERRSTGGDQASPALSPEHASTSTPRLSRTDTSGPQETTEDINVEKDLMRAEKGGKRPGLAPQQQSDAGSRLSVPYYASSPGSERYLKPASETQEDYRFKGRFPDQRLSLQYLLEKDPVKPTKGDVVLSQTRSPNRVRYIHIPHNNMKWIEEAIARYFEEERPDSSGIYRDPPVKTRSHMVLRPEYWRGQQHGGRRTMVHARHMRAMCERVSSELWDSEDNPKNLALFMPYLHWEEDRKREKISRIIEEESESYREKRESKEKTARETRIKERTCAEGEVKLKTDKKALKHPMNDPKHEKKVQDAWKKHSFGKFSGKHEHTVTGIAEGLADSGPIEDQEDDGSRKLWYVAKVGTNAHGRVEAASKLGQFLLDAARLYEAMAIYRDQQILETYLHHDPPLHPRRTLDQSYYWTLKTTKARDRDQVVYRGTTMDGRNVHRFREQGEKICQKKPEFLHNWIKNRGPQPPDGAKPETVKKLGLYKWDGHWSKTDTNGCDHCRGEIRKVSRVVMVDQLWMWILDKKTIITSFPKRYGTNKQDASGVHKSIRVRIKNARKNQIRSVFDVALIILDECSNTFFDRTKTPDRQPQVMDIFAESIGTLTNKQTVSFQHLWHWTERAAKIYNSTAKYAPEDATQLHFPLLNINPEGMLQREIKDIIDELDIMINVNNKQREVIKRFTKHVENIYDPSGEWRDESLSPDGDRDYHKYRSSSKKEGAEKVPGPESAREKEEFTWFRKQAYELISDVSDRITELEGLRKSAESTSQGIKDLLDLKQQQASILQAWQSVKQADESVRQGRSIMIFTIVTIIFLPLSFMSSIFGMNNKEIGENQMHFREQANYMFPISAGVILISIIFAFWTFPRTVFWSIYKLTETWLLVNTGAYRLWLCVLENIHILKSEVLLKKLEEQVENMKGKVRKQHWKRQLDKKAPKEKKTEGNRAVEQQEQRQNGHSALTSTTASVSALASINGQNEASESVTSDGARASRGSLLRKWKNGKKGSDPSLV